MIRTSRTCRTGRTKIKGISPPAIRHTQYAIRETIHEIRFTIHEICLLQLDGPVGVIEELLPAAVTLVAEVNMHQRIAPRLDRRFDELQA